MIQDPDDYRSVPGTGRETEAGVAFERATHLLRERQVLPAIRYFDTAAELGYDLDACSGGRWMCHMLHGSFEAAWKESDAISERAVYDPYRYWSGRSLHGRRVLIRCLHGLGDTIHFIRYLPKLRTVAHSIVIEAQPLLKDLLQASRLADDVITWGETEPAWDEQIEVVELPRIFRTSVQTIPGKTPYLHLAAAAPKQTKPRCADESLLIALVWAGSQYDPARTIPLELFRPFLDLPNVQLISLQGNPDREALHARGWPIPDRYHPSGSILEAARSLQQVDLLITADTMMAHLAGALNIKCWTLLPFEADWRWLLHRSDSPWYPSMRLFRQPERGNWDAVLNSVLAALRQEWMQQLSTKSELLLEE